MEKAANPRVLVTGGGRRIGAAIAARLHGAGYDVAIHYRHSGAAAQALAAQCNAARPGSAQTFAADLDADAASDRLIESVLDQCGRLDALVNNASRFFPTPIGSVGAAQWNELFASNARAPFFLAQAAAPALRQSRGCILNLIDIYAERPLRGHSVYCMAKAALAMMTRSLARELAPDIRVNGIAPGAVLWPEAGSTESDQAALIARTPLKRCGHPEDIASAALFLLRDAPFVTGHILAVDGGRSL
ncbi:MAG: pteridine reductase [Lysobacterales bacterium]